MEVLFAGSHPGGSDPSFDVFFQVEFLVPDVTPFLAFGPDLLIDFRDPTPIGSGFVDLVFDIFLNGANILNMDFDSDVAAATDFFSNPDIRNLGPLPTSGSASLLFRQTMSLSGSGYSLAFVAGTDIQVPQVPEPGTLVLMLFGLIGLMTYQRFKEISYRR